MTVSDLKDILTNYNSKEFVEIEIYNEVGEYVGTDESPVVDINGLDLVFKAKISK